MKRKTRLEAVALAVLGAVCLFLVVRMVRQLGGASAETAKPRVQTQSAGAYRIRKADPVKSPAAVDPVLNVRLFRHLESDPLVSVERDPFSFGGAATEGSRANGRGTAQGGALHSGPTKPLPPVIPLRALGFTQDRQGVRKAYLTDRQHIFVAREGETFDKTYRVLKITPAYIEVEDEGRNLRAQLAIPQ
jgi:hypothetical protein